MKKIVVLLALLSTPFVSFACPTVAEAYQLATKVYYQGKFTEGLGSYLANENVTLRRYATLFGDGQLSLNQEQWTEEGSNKVIDQWLITINFIHHELAINHRRLVKKDNRILSIEDLDTKGWQSPACDVIRTFLPSENPVV